MTIPSRGIIILSNLVIQVVRCDGVENLISDHQDNHPDDAENDAFDDEQREVF